MRVLSVALLSVLMTTACAPVGLLVGAGATVGTAASKEGGLSQSVSDKRITLYIQDAWFRYDTSMLRKLNVTSTEGRVLLTGIVQNSQARVDAVRLAWQAPGVKQIINEIKVEGSEGLSGYSRDKWIAAQLRSKLVFDKDIESINYTTETVGGIIYIMGVAQNQAELDRVMGYARSIRYVKDVVSYARVIDQNGGYNSKTNSAPMQTNNYTSSTSSSGSYNNAASSAPVSSSSSSNATNGGGYDYQPESRRGALVESGDLAPVK